MSNSWQPEKEIWFPAKRYGWGWGPPVAWQGWMVLLIYFLMLGTLVRNAPPTERPASFFAGVAVSTVALLIICWWKGETPRWRWGDDDQD